MFRTLPSTLAIATLATLPAPSAMAQDESPRALRVVNDTTAAVNQLFASGERHGGLRGRVNGILGTPEDERDRLEGGTLRPGGTIAIALKGKRCRYDLRAVLVDGRSYVAEDFDVCAGGAWAISSGSRR